MGYYTYPHAPGTTFGPCSKPCQHTDCAAQRMDAEKLCIHCNKPIGYDNRIYFIQYTGKPGELTIVHADCDEQKARG